MSTTTRTALEGVVHVHAHATNEEELSRELIIEHIGVGVADVARVIAIRIRLVGIGHIGAVVEAVFDPVTILIGSGHAAANATHAANPTDATGSTGCTSTTGSTGTTGCTCATFTTGPAGRAGTAFTTGPTGRAGTAFTTGTTRARPRIDRHASASGRVAGLAIQAIGG